MEIAVTFPGGKRVDASIGGHVIQTDQPVELGGEDSAPAPFDLFLASIATCAGIYVLGFCQARKIPTDGIRLRQVVELDAAKKLPARVAIEVDLPPSFPAEYRAAVIRAAEGCRVKKSILTPPAFEVSVADTEAATAAE